MSTSEISEPDEHAKQTESAVPDELVSEPVSGIQSGQGWREWDYSADLYINARVGGKIEPTENSPISRVYELDEPVSVVAFTSTRYFKLSSGDYIFAEYLSAQKVYTSETVKTELTYEPPVRTAGRTAYNPQKALDYAKEHWQDEESLCAGFGLSLIHI